MVDWGFSVNEYDRDGDVVEEGIYFHFGDTKVKVADGIDELTRLISNIQRCIPEIDNICRGVGL